MKQNKIPRLEKWIIAVALTASAFHLALIAFAAVKYNAVVPTCVETVEPFLKGAVTKRADKDFEVRMVAKMWAFDPPTIKIPVGSTVEFFLTSLDVTHGFQILGTNVNLMAIPNTVNQARATFKNPGVYPIVCHEYCGVGHQAMSANIEVIENYAEPVLEDVTNAPKSPEVFTTFGCVGCHSLDGTAMAGPTFKGLYGKTEQLVDGTSFVVDDAYLKESILLPQKKVVKGFEQIPMPALPLTEDQTNEIINWIKTLK